jgi:tetratricopeptide (TPR) repeat protein/transglutaminase-like putative cysteine protease
MDTRSARGWTSTLALSALIVSASVTSGKAQKAPADNSQEAVVVEQARVALRFESDGTARRETYMRLKTQSQAGVQQWGQLLFGYDAASERPEIAFVRVRKPDGSVVTTPSDAVQDLSSPVTRVAPVYTDFRQKHVTVQSLRPGDTLEFSVVTVVHTPLARGEFWTEYDFQDDAIVLDEQLEIDVPDERRVTLKTRAGFDPAIETVGGRRTYRWKRSHLVREDPDSKEVKNKIVPDEPEPPAVRLTTFQSWEHVGHWFADLETAPRTATPAIVQKARELTAGRSTDMEKLETLYDFVAANFRYVSLSLGMGRYQPRAADDVLREQYGDCKDKHTLLASLIEASGLHASAVLIHSRLKLDPQFPSPSQFDHVITRVVVGKDVVWLDATAEVAPFRLLAFPLRKKQALVVDRAGPAHLEETPADPPVANAVLQNVDATLADAGKLNARVRLSFRGDSELVLRTIFRATPNAQWKQLLQELLKQQRLDGDVSDWKVSDPAATRTPFTMEFLVSVKDFVDGTKKSVQVPLPFADISLPSVDGGSDADVAPMKLGPPADFSYHLKLELPEGSRPRIPVPVALTRDYGDYTGSYTLTGNTFVAERRLRRRETELPSARRQDYAAFTRVVNGDSKQLLTLESMAVAVKEGVPPEIEVRELNRSGYEAIQAGNYPLAITLLKRVVEREPKDKSAWNNLGRAYLALRQTDAAIEAFKRQIEVNPYDEYAYNNIGRAYLRERKYDEAESAFQKQIEINPLDRYAHGNLGGMYLERKQYDRAAGELEKTAALVPDNPALRIQLGQAYFGLNRNADATASFDKAVELSPTPGTWNSIAYELSLRSVDLDRAQQYAESAVAATTAASRNVDVEHADDQAFGVVSSLAAYWDTLGWVYFKKGDLARAEKLVGASWQLSQEAEVGDHLGQIYEKLGRLEAATSAYAMALAADRPDEEVRTRLEAIAGGKGDVNDLVAQHRSSLAKIRIIELQAKGPAGKKADFYLVFAAPAVLESVKFAAGDEAVRPMGSALRQIKFSGMFPDDAPAKLIRRGVVACEASGACVLTLESARDARAVK